MVNPCMGWVLGGLQDQLMQILIGRIPRRREDIKREYTSAATAREVAVSETIEEYIRQSQNIVEHYNAMQ